MSVLFQHYLATLLKIDSDTHIIYFPEQFDWCNNIHFII